MPLVHPTAVVDPSAELGEQVEIGAFCFVGAGVRLGRGTRLLPRATVLGPSTLGENNLIYPGAVLGAAPQDRSYRGEPSRLVVGDDNVFREQTTVHRGTEKGGGITRVGSRCWLLVGAHIAHDCELGDGVTLTNLATLGGHVRVGQEAVFGGLVAIAPYVRVGRTSFVAGGARVETDVPPFVIVQGDRARVRALNRVGLQRAAVPAESVALLEVAFRTIFGGSEPRSVGLARVEREMSTDPWVLELIGALRASP